MTKNTTTTDAPDLIRIEPEDRFVVLARTIEAQNSEAESAFKESAVKGARLPKAGIVPSFRTPRTSLCGAISS